MDDVSLSVSVRVRSPQCADYPTTPAHSQLKFVHALKPRRARQCHLSLTSQNQEGSELTVGALKGYINILKFHNVLYFR